jgi:MOSC domain-containing protein YiiM
MQLLSVNVALPTAVSFQQQRVETGIFKKPVVGPVKVRGENLEGERQADLSVHGGPDKAVYVYSWKNIEYWRARLEREDLRPGTFGENLTVDELLDSEVFIGDRLEIGTARFQVTQPRLPCFKLGIVLGLPDFPATFQRSGRTGFYLRVLQEGSLASGDAIRRREVTEGPKMTVAEFVGLVTDHTPSREELSRMLSLKALSAAWKERLARKLNAQAP